MARFNVEVRPGIAGLETWTLRDEHAGATVEFLPARGALVSRFKVGDDDVLYLDRATVADLSKNVRGGVPVLFPTAGRLPDNAFSVNGRRYELPQHGFARTSAWTALGCATSAEHASAECMLASSDETLGRFPWAFEYRLRVSLFERRLRIDSSFRNLGDTPMPLHAGFHPYFRVPLAEKARASVPTSATRAFDNASKSTGPVTAIDFSKGEVDLHLLDHREPGATLRRGSLPTVQLRWSDAYRTLVLWTQPEKDFICVEPWTAPGGALATGEGLVHVAPGTSAELFFEIAVL